MGEECVIGQTGVRCPIDGRHRIIDGIRYISNCLGYPHERDRGETGGGKPGPKVVWDTMKRLG